MDNEIGRPNSDDQDVPNTRTHIHQLSAPGEWALQKLFGPSLDAMGADLYRAYEAARNGILNAAIRKTPDMEDGKRTNIRVAHGVLAGGAFSDSEICAEYFGGILASSRSEEGQNDDSIQFVEVTKSLSSKQLHLHYVIYNRMNKLFVANGTQVNVGMSTEIQTQKLWFSSVELSLMGLKVDTDFNILWKHGLTSDYQTNIEKRDDGVVPYCSVVPTTFGVMLYAASHNRYEEWRQFNSQDFGDYKGISLPLIYKNSFDDLVSVATVRTAVD